VQSFVCGVRCAVTSCNIRPSFSLWKSLKAQIIPCESGAHTYEYERKIVKFLFRVFSRKFSFVLLSFTEKIAHEEVEKTT